MTTETNMTQGKPMPLLLGFSLPLMLGNVFQQFYTIADTAIIGQGVGMNALAAIGCIDWLIWMMASFIQGFSHGYSIRIAQKYGEGNIPEMKRFIGQSAILAALLAVFYLVVGQLTLSPLLHIMRVPTELSPLSETYLRILMLGAPAIAFFNYCSAVLRAIGDSKTPLKAMVVASIINIILDLVAVFIFEWGIAGAAIATIISQCFSGIVCCHKIVQTELLHFSKNELKKNPVILKNLVLLGSPTALKNITIALGGIIVQVVVNGFGTGFIAGFTATNKLFGLLEIAALSYGYAVTTYTSQNYGAKQYTRIREGLRAALILGFLTCIAIAVFMFAFGRQLSSLFISSDVPALVAEAKYIAYLYLRVLSVFLPFLYLMDTLVSVLQGMGDTVSTFISGVLELIVRIIISILVSWTGFKLGIFGGEFVAWMTASAYLVIHYRKKIKSLT